ncbi:MAG: hypothetical protein AAFN41_09780, partial [Planctomycetota bacterium]
MRRALWVALILFAAAPAAGQRTVAVDPGVLLDDSAGLSPSQIDELDREGAIAKELLPTKPPVGCPDILDRVARSQLGFLERNSRYYMMLPNGDAINAYRALRLREIEDAMRFAHGTALERLERELRELAPGGENLFVDADGNAEYLDEPPRDARQGETVYDYRGLPPMFEQPVRPHADTLAAHAIFGSRLDQHRGNDFVIDQQTDHWLVGRTIIDGEPTSQRIAVLRTGTRVTGTRLERACVLWPLNRTAESRRTYWDRAPLPLYVALNAEDFRATPADLACAAERGRVVLRNYTA